MKFNLEKTNSRIKIQCQKLLNGEKKLRNTFHLFTKYFLSICSTTVVSLWGGDGIQEAMWWVREAEADEARNHYNLFTLVSPHVVSPQHETEIE